MRGRRREPGAALEELVDVVIRDVAALQGTQAAEEEPREVDEDDARREKPGGQIGLRALKIISQKPT